MAEGADNKENTESKADAAVKALVDKQLVSKTPNGYLVSDRFFAKWLMRGGITS